jgi:hypothetical protein
MWENKLKYGEIICRVWHKDELITEFTPTDFTQLWATIDYNDGEETLRGSFEDQFIQFIESGKRIERYEGIAWKDVYKFGTQFYQYTEEYIVEFEDKYRWYRRPFNILNILLKQGWEFLIYKQNGYQDWPNTIAFKTYRWK